MKSQAKSRAHGWYFALVLSAAAVVSAYFVFDLGNYLSLDYLKAHQALINDYFLLHPALTAVAFSALYLSVTSLSIPGTALLTLASGAIFGLFWGTILVSFSSAIGATLAFLSSRFLFRDWVQRRFAEQLVVFNRGFEQDGAFYVISLGLIPVVPYSVINLVMGLTTIRTSTFYWASQTGMFIETVLIVNAGTHLAQVESLSDLFSAKLMTALALLGLVPLLVKMVLTYRRKLGPWRRPSDG